MINTFVLIVGLLSIHGPQSGPYTDYPHYWQYDSYADCIGTGEAFVEMWNNAHRESTAKYHCERGIALDNGNSWQRR